MRKRYRLLTAATVGGLIVLAALIHGKASEPACKDVLAELPISQGLTPEYGVADQTNSVTCEADCQVSFSGRDKADIGSTTDFKQANTKCDTVIELDLVAQKQMSHWTAYVAGLTGIGVILLILTLVEAFQGSEAAKIAADAAKLQAQAAINAGRAFLTPLDPDLRSMPVQNEAKDLSKWMGFRARVLNRGLGPGFLHVIATGHSIQTLNETPKGKENLDRGDPMGRILIDKDGHWGVEETPLTAIKLTDEDIELLQDGWHYLHIFGYFEYSDLFGVLRRTGFHYSYLPKERVLLTERGPDLWYDDVVQGDRESGYS